MRKNDLQDYLTDSEKLELVFDAREIMEKNESEKNPDGVGARNIGSATFGATDRRIVYLTESGGFTDIEYSHIKSYSSETNDVTKVTDKGKLIIASVFGMSLGFFALVSSILSGIYIIAIGGVGLVIGLSMEGEINKKHGTEHEINLQYGDISNQDITVKTEEENIGPQLSSIIRQYQE